MTCLLDTHSFLWFVWSDSRLSETARSAIEDSDNEILFSSVSAWEMAIKISTGKLSVGQELGEFLESQLSANRFTYLPLTIAHSAKVSSLPIHHKDPFDRMLVAQSLVETVPMISNENLFDQYGVSRIW